MQIGNKVYDISTAEETNKITAKISQYNILYCCRTGLEREQVFFFSLL